MEKIAGVIHRRQIARAHFFINFQNSLIARLSRIAINGGLDVIHFGIGVDVFKGFQKFAIAAQSKSPE